MPGAPLLGSSSLRFRIRGHFGPAFRPTVSSRGPAPNRAVSGPHSQRALPLSAPLGAARDSGPSLGPANPQPPVFSRSGRAPPLAPLRGHRLSKAEPPWGGHRPCPVTPRDFRSQVLSSGTGIAPSPDSVSLTGAEHLCSIPWVSSGAGRPRLNQETEEVKVIFPTQGSNRGLPHCKRILYQLTHHGSAHLSQRDVGVHEFEKN